MVPTLPHPIQSLSAIKGKGMGVRGGGKWDLKCKYVITFNDLITPTSNLFVLTNKYANVYINTHFIKIVNGSS